MPDREDVGLAADADLDMRVSIDPACVPDPFLAFCRYISGPRSINRGLAFILYFLIEVVEDGAVEVFVHAFIFGSLNAFSLHQSYHAIFSLLQHLDVFPVQEVEAVTQPYHRSNDCWVRILRKLLRPPPCLLGRILPEVDNAPKPFTDARADLERFAFNQGIGNLG